MFRHVFVLLVGSVLMSIANGRYESIPERSIERLIDNGYKKGGIYDIMVSRPRTMSKDSYVGSTKYNRYGIDTGANNEIAYKYIDDNQPYRTKGYCDSGSNSPVKRLPNSDYDVENVGLGVRIYRPYDIRTISKYINGNVNPITMKIAYPYRSEKYGGNQRRGRYYGYDRLLPYPANLNMERNYGLSESDAAGMRTYSERSLAAWPGNLESENSDDRNDYDNSALTTDNANLNSNTNIVRHRRQSNGDDRFFITDRDAKNLSANKNDDYNVDEIEMEKDNE